MPVAWTAYTYCGNNPTSRIDPTGTLFNLVKFTVGVLAVVALTAAIVISAGAFAPAGGAAIAAEQAAAEEYVIFGELTGGAVGGITVAREESEDGRSPDVWDVLLGAAVGAAVSGWATYASVYGETAPGKLTGEGVGRTVFGSEHDALAGGLNNAVTQTAIGFAHAIARPIAGTGGLFDKDFREDIAQSFISKVLYPGLRRASR